MEVFNRCVMPSRLEITYEPKGKTVCLSRCCYIHPFVVDMPIKDFLKIKDLISFAEEESSKVDILKKPAYEGWCTCPCILSPKIEVVTVSFSKACNLHCYHCFFTEHKDEPDTRDLQFETLEKIKGHSLEKIHLISSGEVFFYYYKVIQFLKGLTPKDTKVVDFQSNLTLLSHSRIDELKAISDATGVIYNFSPSIDGITKESFEAVRIGASWEKVMDNLLYLRDTFGSQNIFVNFTLKKPAFSEINKVKAFFKFHGIDYVQISPDIYDDEAKKLVETL